MSKTIQGFREKDYGLFIDLTDAMSSVSVDRKTGNLVLREGAGPDRFNGALITSDFCQGFTLSSTPEGIWVIALRFGEHKSHVLGTTDDEAGALQWLKKAWDVIRSKQTNEQSTEISPPSKILAGFRSFKFRQAAAKARLAAAKAEKQIYGSSRPATKS